MTLNLLDDVTLLIEYKWLQILSICWSASKFSRLSSVWQRCFKREDFLLSCYCGPIQLFLPDFQNGAVVLRNHLKSNYLGECAIQMWTFHDPMVCGLISLSFPPSSQCSITLIVENKNLLLGYYFWVRSWAKYSIAEGEKLLILHTVLLERNDKVSYK